jgi:tetratricopeptide (TPR) repeat protein
VRVQLMPGSGGVSQDVQTDSTGKFQFAGLAPIRYTIVAQMPGYGDVSEEFDMSVQPSHYSHLTLRRLATGGPDVPPNVPPDGAASMTSALPADMPGGAKREFNDGYNIFTGGKDLAKSIPHFRKVTELYPSYAPAYLLLGTACARTGKEKEAISPLRKAIELDPKQPDAYAVLGGIYNSEKQFAEAEPLLQKGVELDRSSYEAEYQLGRALYFEQKPADAQPHLEAALKLNPRSAEAHIMLANVMLRQRDAAASLKEYEQGVELDPKGPMSDGARQMIVRIQTALAQKK